MSDAGRRWLEVSVRCPSVEESIPMLAEGLVDLGGRAALEQEGWCVTHLCEPDDPEAPARAEAIQVRALLPLRGPCAVRQGDGLRDLRVGQRRADRERAVVRILEAGDGRRRSDALRDVVALVTALPEYQLC